MTFELRYNEVWDKLGTGSVVVLATEYNGVPYARKISAVFFNQKIYFQTDRTMDKAIHIRINKNVSVCIENIQIQGKCKEMYHPLSEEGSEFLMLFKKIFPKACEKYSALEDERIFVVEPLHFKIWSKIENNTVIELLDCEKGIYEVRKVKVVSDETSGTSDKS